MKRILAAMIILALAFPAAALAEADLSGMTYEELVALREQLNLAIWNSDEWQQVTVPQGVWEIGVDIPAGHWTIGAADGAYALLTWCEKLNDLKTDADLHSPMSIAFIKSPTMSNYEENSDKVRVDWELTEGTYLIVSEGSVVFTPYTGKPDLGFK